ncbi:MAG TPA: hypothetical protein VNI83_01200, partial [Vicinamibacterales bacterium]|nr:hypothetical protein [Vicinamibacterales bacterium]
MVQAITCPVCGAKLRVGRARCLRCGHRLSGGPQGSSTWLRRAGAVALAALALSALLAIVGVWRSAGTPEAVAVASAPAAP